MTRSAPSIPGPVSRYLFCTVCGAGARSKSVQRSIDDRYPLGDCEGRHRRVPLTRDPEVATAAFRRYEATKVTTHGGA